MLKVIRLKLPVIWLLVSMWLNTLTKSQIWTFFFFQAEDGIRDIGVTGVQVCSSDLSYFYQPRCAGSVKAEGAATIGAHARWPPPRFPLPIQSQDDEVFAVSVQH